MIYSARISLTHPLEVLGFDLQRQDLVVNDGDALTLRLDLDAILRLRRRRVRCRLLTLLAAFQTICNTRMRRVRLTA